MCRCVPRVKHPNLDKAQPTSIVYLLENMIHSVFPPVSAVSRSSITLWPSCWPVPSSLSGTHTCIPTGASLNIYQLYRYYKGSSWLGCGFSVCLWGCFCFKWCLAFTSSHWLRTYYGPLDLVLSWSSLQGKNNHHVLISFLYICCYIGVFSLLSSKALCGGLCAREGCIRPALSQGTSCTRTVKLDQVANSLLFPG